MNDGAAAERERGMRVFRLVGSIFLLAALALAAACYLTVRNSQRFLAEAERADGMVVALSRSESASDGVHYRPVVTYPTAAGEEIEFVSSWGSRPAAYRRGDAVTVLYRPSDPNGARIERFFPLWGASSITGGLGLVFGILSAVLLAIGRRPPARS